MTAGPSAQRRSRARSAAAAASLDALAAESEAIITILPTSAIVAEVMNRVLPALRPGTLLSSR